MSGFYSKDFILESAFGQYCISSIVVWVFSVTGAIFTTGYSVKILYLTFLTAPNGPKVNYTNTHDTLEGDFFLVFPLVILALFSVFFGYLAKDLFLGLGTGLFSDNSIFTHPNHEISIDTEFAVPVLFKLLPFFLTLSFSAIIVIFSEFFPELILSFKLTKLSYSIFGFFNQKGLIDMFYNKFIVNLVLTLGGQTTRILDKGVIELVGPLGLEQGLVKLSKAISSFSTGVVTSYALFILLGFISYIIVCFYSNETLNMNLLILIVIILVMISKGESSRQVSITKSKRNSDSVRSVPFESRVQVFRGKNVVRFFF